MPVLDSDFQSAILARNAHVQTIAGALQWQPKLQSKVTQLELADRDVLEIRHAIQGRRVLLILSHGLEGSAQSSYIRALWNQVLQQDLSWDVLAWNFRGCGSDLNRLPRAYHSGAIEDLQAVIETFGVTYEKIFLVGYSLGGNLTLKYLQRGISKQRIAAAVTVSVPMDLSASARCIDERPANRFYRDRFLKTLKHKVLLKSKCHRMPFSIQQLHEVTSLRQFDDLYTAPLHGFVDAEDYYQRCQSLDELDLITSPTLIVSALDDPFLSDSCYPKQSAMTSEILHVEYPALGGHVGFWSKTQGFEWLPQRILQFLKQYA